MSHTKKTAIVIGGAISDDLKKKIDELVADAKAEVILVDDLTASALEPIKAENEELKTTLAEMSAELSTAQGAAEKGYQVVKSGKKTYRIHGKKFNYKGKEVTVDQLQKDSKLVDELVKLKVGFLTEVTETKEG